MSFLTPLFLIGGAAIAAPIIFHLIRRVTRERTKFSSLMFLLPSPPRLSKRHRLEHWLLLLLRCLALLLLAFGFSRPFFKQTQLNDPSAAQPKRIIVLLDTSASMRRAGVWDEARSRAEAVLRRAGPADQVAVYIFDRQATPLVGFEDWNRAGPNERVPLAMGRIGGVAPGWGGTALGNALITAAEALAENESRRSTGTAPAVQEGPREIYIVSDLQAGSRLDTLQAYEWPKGVQLFVEPVRARTVTNAGVQLVAEATDTTRAVDAAVRVRVSNSADAKREQFKLGWARASAASAQGSGTEFIATPIDAYVPPGQSRVFSLPTPKGQTVELLALQGDDEFFDNLVYLIPPAQQRAGVLWLGSEKETDVRQSLFFLRRAFFDTPRLAVKVTQRASTEPVTAEDLRAANVIFVSEALPAATAAALREQAAAGKLIVVVPKGTDVAATLGTLVGREGLALGDVRPTNYAMFSEIDFRHPLFAPFADPRFSDFTKIHIWRYRRLDATQIPQARVLAKFDSGDPAIIEAPVGKGRVFVLATSWQPDDSQFAVSSKFVPLLWSWLELGGGVPSTPAQYVVGDKVALPAERAAGETASVRGPDGATVTIPAEQSEFAQATRPGIYELTSGGRTQRFAVNVDANETRTAPLGLDELEQLGLPISKTSTATPAQTEESKSLLQGVEAEGRQKLWRWFIVATLAILLFETWLAGRTARQSVLKPEEAATP